MTFKAEMIIQEERGENARGYMQYERLATFNLTVDPERAFEVFQHALARLTDPVLVRSDEHHD